MTTADRIRRSSGRFWPNCNSSLIGSNCLANRARLQQDRDGIGFRLLSLWLKEDCTSPFLRRRGSDCNSPFLRLLLVSVGRRDCNNLNALTGIFEFSLRTGSWNNSSSLFEVLFTRYPNRYCLSQFQVHV